MLIKGATKMNRQNPIDMLWREMNGFRNEVDRFLGRFSPTSMIPTGMMPTAMMPGMGQQAARTMVQTPAVNVWEDDNSFHIEADLPAINLEKLDVVVTEGNRLIIQGEHAITEPRDAVWHRQERALGVFSREVMLPTPVNADHVKANYEQGVLKLVLPKSEAAKPRKITVHGEATVGKAGAAAHIDVESNDDEKNSHSKKKTK